MKLAELIKEFCEINEGYSFYGDYSGRFMFGKKCVGIVVNREYSYMNMLIQLTRFLEENDVDDVDLELSNPAIDEMGLDTIVYFPNIDEKQRG